MDYLALIITMIGINMALLILGTIIALHIVHRLRNQEGRLYEHIVEAAWQDGWNAYAENQRTSTEARHRYDTGQLTILPANQQRTPKHGTETR